MDFVKTRLQNDPRLTVKQVIQNTYHNSTTGKRGIGNFYRGLAPNLIGVTPEKAIKLAVNDSVREYIAKNWEGHGDAHKIRPLHGQVYQGNLNEKISLFL